MSTPAKRTAEEKGDASKAKKAKAEEEEENVEEEEDLGEEEEDLGEEEEGEEGEEGEEEEGEDEEGEGEEGEEGDEEEGEDEEGEEEEGGDDEWARTPWPSQAHLPENLAYLHRLLSTLRPTPTPCQILPANETHSRFSSKMSKVLNRHIWANNL